MVKKYFRECFRYKITGWTMLICFSLSFIVIYYGVTIYNNIFQEYRDKSDYKYNSETWFQISRFDDGLKYATDGEKCNLKMCNCMVYSDSKNVTGVVDIVIASYEENIPLVSGHYATEEEIQGHEKIVVLGKGNAKDAYERDGEQYYRIFGEEYKVIGVIGTDNSSLYDYRTILYIDCLYDNLYNEIIEKNSFGYSMVIESNAVDTLDVYKRCIESDYGALLSNDEILSNGTAMPVNNEKEYCLVIFVFCFISLYVTLSFWIAQQKKEMQVCRAFGFSNKRLLGRIAKALLRIIGLGFAVSIICILLINRILGNIATEYRFDFNHQIIVPFILIFTGALILVCIKPIYQALRMNVASVLTEKR